MFPFFASARRLQTLSRPLITLLASAFAFATPALAQRTIHVPADAPSIQAGINTAANGDTVLVAPGTYLENIDFNGKAITVTSSNGPALTILDGNGGPFVAFFHNGEQRNSVLQGFTIQNGGNEFSGVPSGGVLMDSCAPTISQNVISANRNYGIDALNAAPLIQGNRITGTLVHENNAALSPGSGIRIYGNYSSPTLFTQIDGNTIEQNTNKYSQYPFDGGGGGIYLQTDHASITNNIIRNNVTPGPGGGVRIIGQTYDTQLLPSLPRMLIAQNLIFGNQASSGGGISIKYLQSADVSAVIANNTVAANTATSTYASVASQISFDQVTMQGGMDTLLVNNIISGNSPQPLIYCGEYYFNPQSLLENQAESDHNLFWNPGGPTFSQGCSNNHAWLDTTGDPAFVNSSGGDFHLLAASPAIDAGNNSAVGLIAGFDTLLTRDLDGSPRVVSANPKRSVSTIDIGAYEAPGTVGDRGTLLGLVPSSTNLNAKGQVTLTVVAISANGTPQGTINFLHQEGAAPPSAILNPTGTAITMTGPLTAGLHSFIATCDCSTGPGQSIEQLVLVDGPLPTSTITAITASPNPSDVGGSVTFSINVSGQGDTPTGSITLADGTSRLATLSLTAAKASFSTSSLSRGVHTIIATYSGDITFAASSGTVVHPVVGLHSTTTLSTSATNVQANGLITLTASTVIQPGTNPDLSKLQILDGTNPLTPLAPLSANSLTFSGVFAPGTHILTGSYTGDSVAEPSTSQPITIVVQPYPTATAISFIPRSGIAFQDLVATAAVSASPATSVPTGSITFHTATAILGTASLGNGTASIKLNLPAGNYAITCDYTPTNAAFLQSSSRVTLFVDRAPVMLSLTPTFTSPIPQSTPASFTFRFADGTGHGLATGSLFLLVDGKPESQPMPLALLGSTAVSNLPPGSHTVALAYSGDSNFLPTVTAAVPFTVLQRDFAITGNQTISIPAGRYRGMPLNLASIGDFTGQVGLACADLPLHASCRFTQAPVGLSAGGTASTTLVVDTSALPGYESAADRSTRPANRRGIFAAALSPLALLSLLLMRRRRPRYPALYLCARLSAALLLTVAAAQLSGCSGLYPASTPPGTYTIHIVGNSGNIAHTHTLTITVTPQNGH